MKVQVAENGWPGIFIPGDEALGMSCGLKAMAEWLDGTRQDTSMSNQIVADWMRRRADDLEQCRVSHNENAVERRQMAGPFHSRP